VHNVRIERLWRDVTEKVGLRWYRLFERLEDEGNYNCDNPAHLWLGCVLFLPAINHDLELFRRQHNDHPITTEHNLSPHALFFLSQSTSGVRGLWPADRLDGPVCWPTEADVDIEVYAGAEDTERSTQAEWRQHVLLEDQRSPFDEPEDEEAFKSEVRELPSGDALSLWTSALGVLDAHLQGLEGSNTD
jgi:hypothetical protein